MTKEELDVIERSIAFFISCAAVTTIFIKMFEWLKARDKEKSVGETKVAALMEANVKLYKAIDELQKSDIKQNETLTEQKSDIKQVMSLVLGWFKGNK